MSEVTIRRSGERGRAEFGWLSSRHTFSFGSYHDPRFVGFGPLRVINEDRVQPGQGFGSPDSLGTGSIIRAGDVQRMSAGSSLGQPLDPQRRAWLQVARGDLALADLTVHAGDAVDLTAADALGLRAVSDAELLLFDLPGAGA